jgi:pimeloyl-[acyl-carrier protein] methyl ester esterase
MTVQVHLEGRGPDLVLLHGWGMNAAVWRALSGALARDFRVHAVEMPGYGVAAATRGCDAAAVVDALAAALPQKALVCGWSLGGQLALAWAQRHPAQVTRLVLLATTPRFVCGAGWTHGMPAAEFGEFAGDLAASPPRARLRFLSLQANGDSAAREVLRELRLAMDRGGEPAADALTAGLQMLREGDLRDALPRIAQPALVMHGVNDALIPHAAGAWLARALPQAAFESVPAAAHAFFVTREALLAERIRAFDGGH